MRHHRTVGGVYYAREVERCASHAENRVALMRINSEIYSRVVGGGSTVRRSAGFRASIRMCQAFKSGINARQFHHVRRNEYRQRHHECYLL